MFVVDEGFTVTKPAPFHGFIGQRHHTAYIKKLVEGSRASGKALPHMLLTGSSGLGKSELARAIAKSMEAKLRRFTADKTFLASTALDGLASGDMVFIDEAHAIPMQMQEALYDHLDAKEANKVHPDTPVPECTFIIATDQSAKLTNAFRKRLVVSIHLQPYAEEELIDIIAAMSIAEGLIMSPQARRQLARVSQGTPRIARHHIQSLACYGTASSTSNVDLATLTAYLEDVGIDERHRTRLQRKYLATLLGASTGAASLGTLASFLSCEEAVIERDIEPFLIQSGWMEITSKGRRLTAKGRDSLAVALAGDVKSDSEVAP